MNNLVDYIPMVTNTLKRYVTDPCTIEDLTNDVMVKLIGIDKSDTVQKYRNFIITTTINTAIDHLRKEKVRNVIDIEPKSENILDVYSVSPESYANNVLIFEEVESFMKQQPKMDQMVFELYFEKDLDLKQIAQKCDIPLGTVKSKINRLTKRFQKHFKSY